MKITYTKKDYRKMIRGEITFNDLTHHAMEKGENVSLIGPDYRMTFNDFLHALKVLNGNKISSVSQWIDTLIMESEHCGFARLLEYSDCTDLVETLYHASFDDYLSQKGILRGVCTLLFQYFDKADPDSPADLSLYISILSDWKYNQGKSVEQWRLHDVFKKKWLKQFDFEDDLNSASDEQVHVICRWTDDLVRKNDEDALWFKAFAMYGGNRVYPENWKESEKLLKKLVEIHQNPWAANALGYIYLLGRNGRKNDSLAAKYFTMGMLHEITESTYQLADLFLEGKGVPQDAEAALKLYGRAYLDSLSLLLAKNWENRFADAAYRMGRAILLSHQKDMNMFACSYFLQASLGMKYRSKYAPAYGDEIIQKKINDAVAAMKKQISSEKEECVCFLPALLEQQPDDGGYYEMRVHLKSHDQFTMRICKAVSGSEENPILDLIVTVPEFYLCCLRKDVIFHGNQNPGIDQEDDIFYFDHARCNKTTKQLEFLLAGSLVRSYENVPLTLRKKELEKYTKRETEILRFACIDVQGDLYNALCSDASVKAGDHVLVRGKKMHSEGVVKRVFTRARKDMPGIEKEWLKAQHVSDSHPHAIIRSGQENTEL